MVFVYLLIDWLYWMGAWFLVGAYFKKFSAWKKFKITF